MTGSDSIRNDVSPAPGGGGAGSGADTTLLLSYRFLRCGIVAATVTLGVSLLAEIVRADWCVRNSISAYFYSPSRTIFTGSLMAIGLCLVVLQGDNDVEEVSLNLAGMLAPMVAVVPTSVSTRCDPAFASLSPEDDRFAEMLTAIEQPTRLDLHNNVVAYFSVLLVALCLVWVFPTNFVRDTDRIGLVRVVLGVYIVVVLVFAVLVYRRWEGDDPLAHNLAAIGMFVSFAVVVGYNAFRRRDAPSWYRQLCRAIFALMVVMAIVVFPILRWVLELDRSVFVLEAVEIVLFAAFWVAQTIAFWQRDPCAGPDEPDDPRSDPRSGPRPVAAGRPLS